MKVWIAAAIAAGIVLYAGDGASAQNVTVVRGSQSTPSNQAGLPTVLRGSGPGAPEAAAPPRAPSGARVIAATGGIVWLADENGNVTACTLRGNGYVGQNTFACTAGRIVR
jgi:hypothetical protein